MIRFHAINNEQQTAYNTPADRSSVAEVVASSDKDDPGTDMLLNFNINMTPQAQIRIITDERQTMPLPLTVKAPYVPHGTTKEVSTYMDVTRLVAVNIILAYKISYARA